MASDQDDKAPLPEDPTDIFIRPTPDEEMPTEEAPRPATLAVPSEPTHDATSAAPITIETLAYGPSSDERTLGDELEPVEPEVSQTVGIHLEDEVSETVGVHLEDEVTQTVGVYLEDVGLHDAETILTPDTPYKGLHPVSLAVNLIPRAWQTIRGLWPILLVVVLSGESIGMRFVDMLVILMFALVSVWNTFIHWATLRYRIHNGRLEINQGLLNRSARTIDPARIQNIELVQNLFHTWSGLVELRIETAGEQTTEGLLSALSVEDATELRNQLAAIGSLAQHDDGDTREVQTVAQIGLTEILAFGLTQRTIGTVAVITAIGLELMSQGGPDVAANLSNTMQPTMLVAAFMLAFVVSWTVSAISALFRYFGFRMVHLGDAIRTEQGLTTKRRVEIPLSKVQLVRADEPLMRRLMGYGTVLIETAGLGFVEGQQRTAEGMVPMVEQPELGRIATTAAPHADVDPWTAKLNPAHPRSLYRGLAGATVRASIFIGIGMSVFGPIKWALLAILPIAWVGAWLDWTKQGWLVTPSAIVSRRGFFNRRTFIVSRDKLQSVHLVQGPLMRLHGLNRMVVSVAGSRIALPETGETDTAWLQQELDSTGGM